MKKIIVTFIFIIISILSISAKSYITKGTITTGLNSTTWTKDISNQIYETNHSNTLGIFGEYGIGFYYKNHNRFRYLGLGIGIDGMKKCNSYKEYNSEYISNYEQNNISCQWIDRDYSITMSSTYIPIYFTYQYIYNINAVSFTYKVNSGVIYNYCKHNNTINTYWEEYSNNTISYHPCKLNWSELNSGFNGYSELKVGLHIPVNSNIGCNLYMGYGCICKNNDNIFEFNEKYTLSVQFNF